MYLSFCSSYVNHFRPVVKLKVTVLLEVTSWNPSSLYYVILQFLFTSDKIILRFFF